MANKPKGYISLEEVISNVNYIPERDIRREERPMDEVVRKVSREEGVREGTEKITKTNDLDLLDYHIKQRQIERAFGKIIRPIFRREETEGDEDPGEIEKKYKEI